MKTNIIVTILCGAAVAATLSGCGKKTDVAGELDRAAKEMGVPEAAPTPAAVPAVAPEAQPAQQQAAAPVPQAQAPAQQMNQAVTAYKSGNLEDAVSQFQRLRSQPAMTPQQRMALQDALAAVMTDIYARAAKGDPRAVQAVKDYERMQNMRR